MPVAPPGRESSHRGAHRSLGGRAIDLGPIRRSDTLLDLLAARRMAQLIGRPDPAAAVLTALTADVDGPAAAPGGAPGRRAARPASMTAARLAGPGRRPGRRRPATRTWARPVASVAVIAGSLAALTLAAVASLTGLMAAGMVARLVRLSGGPEAARPPAPHRHRSR